MVTVSILCARYDKKFVLAFSLQVKSHENCLKEIYLSGYFMTTTKYLKKIKKLPQNLKAPLFITILNNSFLNF